MEAHEAPENKSPQSKVDILFLTGSQKAFSKALTNTRQYFLCKNVRKPPTKAAKKSQQIKLQATGQKFPTIGLDIRCS